MKTINQLRKFVLDRAQGYCQLCNVPAPFKDPDGSPYLEVHHTVPLREGGTSTPENLVALCPNCNAKMNISPSPEDIENLKILLDK